MALQETTTQLITQTTTLLSQLIELFNDLFINLTDQKKYLNPLVQQEISNINKNIDSGVSQLKRLLEAVKGLEDKSFAEMIQVTQRAISGDRSPTDPDTKRLKTIMADVKNRMQLVNDRMDGDTSRCEDSMSVFNNERLNHTGYRATDTTVFTFLSYLLGRLQYLILADVELGNIIVETKLLLDHIVETITRNIAQLDTMHELIQVVLREVTAAAAGKTNNSNKTTLKDALSKINELSRKPILGKRSHTTARSEADVIYKATGSENDYIKQFFRTDGDRVFKRFPVDIYYRRTYNLPFEYQFVLAHAYKLMNRRGLIISPTGTGKTMMMLMMAREMINANKIVFIFTLRGIIDQFVAELLTSAAWSDKTIEELSKMVTVFSSKRAGTRPNPIKRKFPSKAKINEGDLKQLNIIDSETFNNNPVSNLNQVPYNVIVDEWHITYLEDKWPKCQDFHSAADQTVGFTATIGTSNKNLKHIVEFCNTDYNELKTEQIVGYNNCRFTIEHVRSDELEKFLENKNLPIFAISNAVLEKLPRPSLFVQTPKIVLTNDVIDINNDYLGLFPTLSSNLLVYHDDSQGTSTDVNDLLKDNYSKLFTMNEDDFRETIKLFGLSLSEKQLEAALGEIQNRLTSDGVKAWKSRQDYIQTTPLYYYKTDYNGRIFVEGDGKIFNIYEGIDEDGYKPYPIKSFSPPEWIKFIHETQLHTDITVDDITNISFLVVSLNSSQFLIELVASDSDNTFKMTSTSECIIVDVEFVREFLLQYDYMTPNNNILTIDILKAFADVGDDQSAVPSAVNTLVEFIKDNSNIVPNINLDVVADAIHQTRSKYHPRQKTCIMMNTREQASRLHTILTNLEQETEIFSCKNANYKQEIDDFNDYEDGKTTGEIDALLIANSDDAGTGVEIKGVLAYFRIGYFSTQGSIQTDGRCRRINSHSVYENGGVNNFNFIYQYTVIPDDMSSCPCQWQRAISADTKNLEYITHLFATQNKEMYTTLTMYADSFATDDLRISQKRKDFLEERIDDKWGQIGAFKTTHYTENTLGFNDFNEESQEISRTLELHGDYGLRYDRMEEDVAEAVVISLLSFVTK